MKGDLGAVGITWGTLTSEVDIVPRDRLGDIGVTGPYLYESLAMSVGVAQPPYNLLDPQRILLTYCLKVCKYMNTKRVFMLKI